MESNMRSKGHWEQKCKSSFRSYVGRFTSNQDQNDHSPILHITSNTFHQRKSLVFVIISNYLRGLQCHSSHLTTHPLVSPNDSTSKNII